MVTYEYRVKCNLCPATFARHKWGTIKACADGWFIQHNGDAFCPDHVPAWVAVWRERGPECQR